jgi:hypothetical protein
VCVGGFAVAEHMAFLGTEKYPDEKDYSKYLNVGDAIPSSDLIWFESLIIIVYQLKGRPARLRVSSYTCIRGMYMLVTFVP